MSGPKDGSDKPLDAREWLPALFDSSPIAIGYSRDGMMVDANAAYVRLFGYSSLAHLKEHTVIEQIAPAERTRISAHIAARAQGENVPEHYQTRGLRADGSEFPFEITTTRITLPEGPMTIAFIVDISDRELALKALHASEDRFRSLSAATLEGVFIHSEGRVVLVNDAGAAMYGYDSPAAMVGVSVMELTSPESQPIVAERVRRQDASPYEGIARRRDGTTFIAEVRGRTLSSEGQTTRVTLIRDVTDRLRMEAEQRALAEQVQQTQRLQSLGVLAGGVAHDFNNILTVISNEVSLAKRDAAGGASNAAHLDAIALAVERATDLSHQMLAYAGKARLEREPVELSVLVAEMSNMLEASISKKVTLTRDLAPGLAALRGDATQIRQIVMNLVLNASEAVSAPHGTIRVTTGRGVYDAQAFARSPAGGAPKAGAYVWLEVADDGVGMDEATLARLFDPFFTTKFLGRGLGMAAVLGIVRSHDGAIDVESKAGKGTRVRVFFPVSVAEAPAKRPVNANGEARGAGVVLLVDDEKNVRVSTELLLRDLGFDVLAARDGVEAIDVFRAESGRLDAVLLDLSMPRMDGMETLKELRRIAPQVPVVLMSGFGSAPLEQQPKNGDEPDAVLPKPYRAERLLSTLKSVMVQHRPGR
jgi:PAS domain S-box-containing protein